jgi:hypothetical protein
MAESLLNALEGSLRIFEKHRIFLLSCNGSSSALALSVAATGLSRRNGYGASFQSRQFEPDGNSFGGQDGFGRRGISMPMLLSDFVLFSFVVTLIAGLLLAVPVRSVSWAQQFSGGSFAYRAQNPATVYVAPGRGFAFSYPPRAPTHDPRALPQSSSDA